MLYDKQTRGHKTLAPAGANMASATKVQNLIHVLTSNTGQEKGCAT